MPFPPTSAALARALNDRNYTDPTAVQSAVLAPDTIGRDLLVSAQTGSGKTVAFGLSIAATLLDSTETFGPAANPLALVVAPTRELALQVQRELTWLYHHTGARIIACVGGMDPRAEKHQLRAGSHIVVGTPGRLRDHLERHNLNVGDLKALVLDEADEMLDLGFREDLEFILEATPKGRRSLLFSATLPRDIVNLAKHYQNNALRIETAEGTRGHADIEYRAIRIAQQDTVHAVVNMIRFVDSPATMVFCNTRDGVRHLHAVLMERGFSAVSLSGELDQTERNHALQALRDGRARVCVATDVAARGIDLPNLDLVIHADLPKDTETLQHRSGRTGRAGRKGVSALLITPKDHRKAERLLGLGKIKAAWINPPSPDAIRKIDNERLLKTLLTAAGESADAKTDDLTLAQELLRQRSAEDIASALVRTYRARLPAPEDLIDTGMPEPRAPRTGLASAVWFKLNVGRQRKADPKWLIPEICRQGGITKRAIGAIRIFDQETKFEIDAEAASAFGARVAKIKKGDIFIQETEAPADGGHVRRTPHGPGKAHGKRPPGEARDKPRWDGKAKKPHRGKHGDDKPYTKSHSKPHGDRHQGNKPQDGKPHGGKHKGKPGGFQKRAKSQ